MRARNKAFRWPKGVSGNPDGQSRHYHVCRKLAREAGPEIMKVLIGLALDSADDERVRNVCATAVLDRGGVKPIDKPEAEPESKAAFRSARVFGGGRGVDRGGAEADVSWRVGTGRAGGDPARRSVGLPQGCLILATTRLFDSKGTCQKSAAWTYWQNTGALRAVHRLRVNTRVFATAATASPPPAHIIGIRTAPTVGTSSTRDRTAASKEDPTMGGGSRG
jgi:hypothetical protein